jgi:ribosomal-protein-alanine N-acetyltransferase
VAGTDPVLGYIVADTVPNHGAPLGHVKDLAVREDVRRQGIARRLLDRALGILGAKGTASVKLEVRESNDAARALYRDVGFVHRRTIPRYYSNGEDAHVLLLED